MSTRYLLAFAYTGEAGSAEVNLLLKIGVTGFIFAGLCNVFLDDGSADAYVVDAVCFVYTCWRLIDLSLIAGTLSFKSTMAGGYSAWLCTPGWAQFRSVSRTFCPWRR